MIGNTHRLWGGVAALVALHAQGALRITPTPNFNMVLPVAVIIGGAVLAGLPDVDLKLHIPHRTVTHSALWPLLLFVFVPAPIGPALAAGLLTHPVLDCLAGRVQIFWPLPWWVGVGLVKTGSIQETIFNVCLGVWVVGNVLSGRL
jgi:membrane-bound metal-dependent hydrolase YbcI (DUF457 family)